MSLAVLNPGGNDPDQSFPDFAGSPSESAHPPVNFHGYAACVAGSFQRHDERIPATTNRVLMLMRGNLKACRQPLVEFRRSKKTVVVSLKESGLFQAEALLSDPKRLELFREICGRAAAVLSPVEELLPIYRAAGARIVEFIPTPYPIEDERWNFSVPLDQRRGIFLGTREFDVPARHHLAALLTIKPLAEAMGEPVTVINTNGWSGRRLFGRLGFAEDFLRVVEGRLSYPKYLQLLARHKLVFQLDSGAVPGQVAGDALLCRVPCVGGNGAIERLAFPDLCGHGRTPEQVFDLAARLLEHPHDCAELIERSLQAARARLSFAAVARELNGLFERLER
jgi:hypothetical protein